MSVVLWLGPPFPSHSFTFHRETYADVGTPLGLCQQDQAQVYYRNFTKGSAVLDCNTWTAQLNF